jgi:hypothetical protein
MRLFDVFKSKKTITSEIEHREFLQTKGRIIDSETFDGGEEIAHYYTVQGMDFESSEILSRE